MTALFTAQDYAALHALVFRPDYPGYRPTIVESPNGDGAQDTDKRYAHVSTKYLDKTPKGEERDMLRHYLETAHTVAYRTALQIGVPPAFRPCLAAGALRVLEYPVGATSAVHTDFDLFTLNLYRNEPNAGLGDAPVHMGELGALLGLGRAWPHRVLPSATVQHSIVYFAIPDHAAVLPPFAGGMPVGVWINERMSRSRYDK